MNPLATDLARAHIKELRRQACQEPEHTPAVRRFGRPHRSK